MQTTGRNTAERRLAAILAADIAGYSRLIGTDEEGTLTRIRSIRADIIDPALVAHRGRLVKTTGDGLLVEFGSVVDALRCAVEIQRAIADRAASVPSDQRLEYRIGIHQSDVIVEEGDIFGDGVNVAARLEALAAPGGICVSARVQEDAAGRLDLAFDDLGDKQLKNIARPVRVFRVQPVSPVSAQQAGGPPPVPASLPLPDKPSIAVLPFQNMSGDAEQEYFVDGMVEEIITALSRIRWLFVIARNSSFTYKGQGVDVKRVGRELGVRYVLEGSVRKAGGRVRITGQLIDAETGAHLWADRFDGSLEDVFELQDKVAASVAGAIEPALQAAETRRSAARPTDDLTAYDFFLQALSRWSSFEREATLRALGLLEKAIEHDPYYGPALALAAHCRQALAANDWIDNAESNRREGIDLARRAMQCAPNDPEVLALAGFTLGIFGEDINVAINLVDRSLSLNPSFARGWQWSGVLRNLAGEPELAIEHFERASRLSPREYFLGRGPGLGAALFLTGRFEEAVVMLLSSLELAPNFAVTYRVLAACYAHMGKIEEARKVIQRLKQITSVVIPNLVAYRKPEHRELLLSGIRKAAREQPH